METEMKTRDLLGLDTIGALSLLTKKVSTSVPQVLHPAVMQSVVKPVAALNATATAKLAASQLAQKTAQNAQLKAKAQSDAAQHAQKLINTANKIAKNFPKQSSRLKSIAAGVKNRAATKIKGDPFGSVVSELMGDSFCRATSQNPGTSTVSLNLTPSLIAA